MKILHVRTENLISIVMVKTTRSWNSTTCTHLNYITIHSSVAIAAVVVVSYYNFYILWFT